MPLGVVVPRTIEEAERAIGIAGRRASAVTARGGGTSQAGQTVNQSLDRRLLEASHPHPRSRRRPAAACVVEPGIVLDELNRALKPHGLVVSGRYLDRLARHDRRHGRQQLLRRPLAALRQHPRERDRRSTPCWPTARRRISAGGGRSLRPAGEFAAAAAGARTARDRRARGRRDRGAVSQGAAPRRRLQSRRAACRDSNDVNLAHILVGSEGTLAFSTAIELKLSPLLGTPRGRRLPFRQLP